jgi:hypothetical protein
LAPPSLEKLLTIPQHAFALLGICVHPTLRQQRFFLRCSAGGRGSAILHALSHRAAFGELRVARISKSKLVISLDRELKRQGGDYTRSHSVRQLGRCCTNLQLNVVVSIGVLRSSCRTAAH